MWSVASVVSDSLKPYGLYSLPGSSVHGILQARILEWIAMHLPGDPPDPGFKPTSPASPALHANSLPLSHWGSPVIGETG